MDFWNSAVQAAEKAAKAAKDLGKKGLEVVEATAEEANRKLNLNLHDKVGAGPGKGAVPSQAELEAYGLTPDFAEFVRTVNYSTFRDFPAEHLLPADSSSPAAAGAASAADSSGSPAYRLNPWQIRHATLVVQALKEVNELRYVLCPKYMTDEHFWHVYFTLARKYLPEAAYSWGPGDALPSFGEPAAGSGDAFSLSGLGSQLMRLGTQLQGAASHSARQAGLELSSLGSSSAAAGGSSSSLAGGSGAAGGAAAVPGAAAEASQPPLPPSGLEEDPDLEAYLQVAISGGSQLDSVAGEEGVGGEDDELDLADLDSYINELSAEVEAEAQQAADVEADAQAAGGKDAKKD